MSGGRRCVEVPVIEIGKDAEDKTRRQAVDDLFLFKAGRWRAMRRWRDQRKADYFHLGRGIFRRINAASPSASAPLRPPPSLHLCGSQLEYAPQSENSTFEPSQSTFEQAPTYNLAALRDLLRRAMGGDPTLKLLKIRFREIHRRGNARHCTRDWFILDR